MPSGWASPLGGQVAIEYMLRRDDLKFRVEPDPLVQWCAVLKNTVITSGFCDRAAAAKYSSAAMVLRVELDPDTLEVISARTEAP